MAEKQDKTPGSCNIKVFVLCHSFMQFSQLLQSAYFKSCITTFERRFGFNSMYMGTVSSLHEVGNIILVVFVSYFGSRVNRPRFIGLGGLIMSFAAATLALPHFLSKPYKYHSVSAGEPWDVCVSRANSSTHQACRQEGRGHSSEARTLGLILAAGQVMFGIGSVPIQPFGISYVDDFAGPGNSALYIAILFSISLFGPAVGYLLGSMTLRIYVDVDKIGGGGPTDLASSDPRWVGAWWMGMLVSSGCLALASVPYFFFFPDVRAGPSKVPKIEGDSLKDDQKKSETSLIDFLKMFPGLLVSMLLRPVFMLLVLSQCSFASSIAGLATFLSKFLEHQYGTTAAYSSVLLGVINVPTAAVGMLVGGVVVKRARPSVRTFFLLCLVPLTLSMLCYTPLFFMGCSTQPVAGVNADHGNALGRRTNRSLAFCSSNCSCVSNFNPVCGEDNTEYISPCQAGCTSLTVDPHNPHRVQVYNMCSCVPAAGAGMGSARPGSCAKSCSHLLLPATLLIGLAGFIGSLSHNPMFMMVLRTVSQEEKSFAIGVQLLLIKMLAWLPAPAVFGQVIDHSCIWWKPACGNKPGACGYYDNDILRNRYFGLQMGYKSLGIVLLALASWRALRGSAGLSLEDKEPDKQADGRV